MIKVLVVVWGLVLFVPDAPDATGSTGLTALVLDTDAWPHVPEHGASLRQFGARLEAPVLRDAFEVAFRASTSEPIAAEGLAHLVALAELTGDPDGARVRRDCMALERSCALDGPMVSGKVRFEGAWSTRPASRCAELELPLGYRDQALWEFRPQAELGEFGPSGESGRRLPTALVLQADVADLRDLVIDVKVGETTRTIPLSESPADVCEDFLGESGRCVVIEMSNGAVATAEPRCEGRSDDPPECRADLHFLAFYDLLTSPPAPGRRAIPVVTANYPDCDSRTGIGNWPSVRCPPPVALPEPP